ncbi:MAG: PAS domain-containing protein [Pseudomonadota bacterium]
MPASTVSKLDYMNEIARHPNTQMLLDAWDHMISEPDSPREIEPTRIHKDLVDSLFILEQIDGAWIFRNAGQNLPDFLGRDLADQDFLKFWTGHDRALTETLLTATVNGRRPGFMHARGETLTGQRIDIEITLAPLLKLEKSDGPARILGLYQTLDSKQTLNGRPVWRHRITQLLPPDGEPYPPQIRLVASND